MDVSHLVPSARPSARVLCVDSNASYLRLYLRALERRSYVVDVAVTGAEALAGLEARACDLVYVATELPDVTGFEVIQRIRSQLGLAVPCVAVAATPRADDRQFAAQYGNVILIRKPFSEARLVRLTVRLLGPRAVGPARQQ